MSYKIDCEKREEKLRQWHELYKLYDVSKKEEDRDRWWKFHDTIETNHYIMAHMTIWPEDGVNIHELKKMIEDGEVELSDNIVRKDGKIVAEIIKNTVSTWPKKAI